MRWDRFFDDLEDQLASEWEAERAVLDTEAERLRLSRVTLRERMQNLAGGEPLSLEFADGTVLGGTIAAVGADWMGLALTTGRGGALAPLAGVTAIALTHPELLRSARAVTAPARGLAERMTIGFVLRDLARRRVPVGVHTHGGRSLTGTIDRAGADHLDLALHEPGAPRRADEVRGYRLVPFASIAWIGLDDPSTFA